MLKRIDIPGATLSVTDVGQGTPVLFVHGFPLNHTMWRWQLEALRHDYRCIAPDLRGFGKSTVTEGIVTMRMFADDLAALIDSLAISQPIVLCGLSMGGYIAWEFARRYSQRLKGLILCDTRAVPDSTEGVANRLKLAEDVVRTGPELVANAMLPKLLADRDSEQRAQLKEELRRVILATDPRGIAAASRGMADRVDARPWLATIDTPALVLVGEQDVISTPTEMSDIAAALPNATFCEIPDSGHLAPLENPQPVNEAIRLFLDSI